MSRDVSGYLFLQREVIGGVMVIVNVGEAAAFMRMVRQDHPGVWEEAKKLAENPMSCVTREAQVILQPVLVLIHVLNPLVSLALQSRWKVLGHTLALRVRILRKPHVFPVLQRMLQEPGYQPPEDTPILDVLPYLNCCPALRDDARAAVLAEARLEAQEAERMVGSQQSAESATCPCC